MRRALVLVFSAFVGAACATGNESPENTGLTGGPLDADGDGVEAPADCDDQDPSVKPGAAEICNGKDDNCDGKIDEGFDLDGDGYAICQTSTKAPDCDDKDPAVNPGAPEVCNNKDDNCNGQTDEGFDKDNDGYYTCARGQTPADCDDDSKVSYPGATEICNGKDDDCDGVVDDIPAVLNGALVAPVNPHWALVGSAAIDSQTGWSNLTPDATDQRGALWWIPQNGAAYTFDEFDLRATFWLQQKSGADGMTFSWVPGTTPNLGGGGQGYASYGLGGYSVAVDTYPNPASAVNPADPTTVPFMVVVDNSTGLHLARITNIPDIRDGGSGHLLRVTLVAGKVSIWLDGINYLNDFVLPGYTPFAGKWGFTAATGGLGNGHAVRDVVMTFPKGQGCVP